MVVCRCEYATHTLMISIAMPYIDDVDVDENDLSIYGVTLYSLQKKVDQSLAECSELLRNPRKVWAYDINHNSTCNLKRVTNWQEIPHDQYRQLLKELNAKQREIIIFHRNWCKKATIALKEDKPAEPYHSGPGCVGKSHVIKWIYSDTLKSYIHEYTQYTALAIQIHTSSCMSNGSHQYVCCVCGGGGGRENSSTYLDMYSTIQIHHESLLLTTTGAKDSISECGSVLGGGRRVRVHIRK